MDDLINKWAQSNPKLKEWIGGYELHTVDITNLDTRLLKEHGAKLAVKPGDYCLTITSRKHRGVSLQDTIKETKIQLRIVGHVFSDVYSVSRGVTMPMVVHAVDVVNGISVHLPTVSFCNGQYEECHTMSDPDNRQAAYEIFKKVIEMFANIVGEENA